jgi:outer membrane murein-binding lipoprotein Lpp
MLSSINAVRIPKTKRAATRFTEARMSGDMIPTRTLYLSCKYHLPTMRYAAPLLFLLLSGCAATQHVDLSSPRDVTDANARLAGERVFVNAADGRTITARVDALRADSAFVYDLRHRRSVVIATRDLSSIETATFQRPIYARTGFTIGAMSAFGAAIIVNAFFWSGFPPESAASAVAATALGGLAGAALYSAPSDDRKVGHFVFDVGR